MTTRNITDAERNARAHLESIVEMFRAAEFIREHGLFDTENPEEVGQVAAEAGIEPEDIPTVDGEMFGDSAIEDRANESALSAEYRSGWESAGEFAKAHDGSVQPEEMRVALTIGGPTLYLRANADGSEPSLMFSEGGSPVARLRIAHGLDISTDEGMATFDERRKALEWYAGVFAYPE